MSRSSTDTMPQVVAAVRARLPPGWTVDAALDTVTIESPRGIGAKLRVWYETAATPMNLRRLVDGPAAGDRLIAAPWLSPRSRQVLIDAGVAYVDLTGNARIVLTDPALFVLTDGADRDPTPRVRVDRGVGGASAARIIRALVDIAPPYTVTELARLAEVDPGYCSRTLQVLADDLLVEREGRGAVVSADWPGLLRRAGEAVTLFDPRRTRSFFARGAIDATIGRLGDYDHPYVVTGSFAAARIRAVTAPSGLVVYTNDVDALAARLDLLPADRGGDVRLITPREGGVYVRSSTVDGVTWAAPSQVVIDCLSGTGRMPQEGEAVLEWMQENERQWRRIAEETR